MLRVQNLEVVYHGVVRVLNGISFEIPEGQVVALLGPNGAGKTTCLRAICGLLPLHNGNITKGSVELGEDNVTAQRPDVLVRRGIIQVMEGRRIFTELTVEENLRAGAFNRRDTEVQSDLEGLLDNFPVLAERRHQTAGLMSGGEQQMLAIARALLTRPKVLLLDEPSLGLSPKLVAQVASMIRAINERGVSILLVEQNAGMALDVADYGYIMENGRIVVDGTAESLTGDRDVREFYLGMGDSGRRNYRDVKRYQRRKRWLS